MGFNRNARDDQPALTTPKSPSVSLTPLGSQKRFPIPSKPKDPKNPEPKLWEPKPFTPAKPGGSRTLEDPVYDPYSKSIRPWGDFRSNPEGLRRYDLEHPGEWHDPQYFAEIEALANEMPPPAHTRDPNELELRPIHDLKKAPPGSSKGLKNILSVLSQASPEELDYWRNWYGFAHVEAVKLAQQHNRPVDLCAGVIAVLSPKEFWEQNLYLADRALAQDWANVKALDPSREKAYALVVDNDFAAIAGGKVFDFFLSILDPVAFAQRVVVDTHAINIWRGVREGEAPGISKSERKRIAADYATAGQMAGLSPQATQAITWTLWRQFAAAGGWDASQQQDEDAWGKGRLPETFAPEEEGDLSDADFVPPSEPVKQEHFAAGELRCSVCGGGVFNDLGRWRHVGGAPLGESMDSDQIDADHAPVVTGQPKPQNELPAPEPSDPFEMGLDVYEPHRPGDVLTWVGERSFDANNQPIQPGTWIIKTDSTVDEMAVLELEGDPTQTRQLSWEELEDFVAEGFANEGWPSNTPPESALSLDQLSDAGWGAPQPPKPKLELLPPPKPPKKRGYVSSFANIERVIDDIRSLAPVDPELLAMAQRTLDRIAAEPPVDVDTWATRLAADFVAAGESEYGPRYAQYDEDAQILKHLKETNDPARYLPPEQLKQLTPDQRADMLVWTDNREEKLPAHPELESRVDSALDQHGGVWRQFAKELAQYDFDPPVQEGNVWVWRRQVRPFEYLEIHALTDRLANSPGVVTVYPPGVEWADDAPEWTAYDVQRDHNLPMNEPPTAEMLWPSLQEFLAYQLDWHAVPKHAGVTVEPKRPAVNTRELGVKPGQGVKNILAVLNAATPEEVDYWARWYHHAKEDVEQLGAKHGVPFEVAAAVVAVLSPGNKWFMNLRAADMVMQSTPRAPQKHELKPVSPPKKRKAMNPLEAWLDHQAKEYVGYLTLQLESMDYDVESPDALGVSVTDPSKVLPYVGEISWDPSSSGPLFPPDSEAAPREYEAEVYNRARALLTAQIPPPAPKRKRKAEDEQQDPVADDTPGYMAPEQPEKADFPGAPAQQQLFEQPAQAEQTAPEVAPGINAYPANIKKAQQILKTGDTSLVNGPKVVEFFQSLMNPSSRENQLVLDGHAINIWRGVKQPLNGMKMPNKREREQMLADYQTAAQQAGLPVQAVQAITWYIWKHAVDSAQMSLFAFHARLAQLAPEQLAAYEREWQQPRDLADVLKEVEFLIRTRGPVPELMQIRDEIQEQLSMRVGALDIGEINLDPEPEPTPKRTYAMRVVQNFPEDFGDVRLVSTDDLMQIASALETGDLVIDGGEPRACGLGVELRFASSTGGRLDPEMFDALCDAVADASLHMAAMRIRIAEAYPRIAIDFSEVVPGRVFMTTTDVQPSFGGPVIPANTALAFEGFHWPGHDQYFGLNALPDLGGTRVDNMRLRFVPYEGGSQLYVLSPNDLPPLQKGEVNPDTGDINFDPQEETSARALMDERIQQYMALPPRYPDPVVPGEWSIEDAPDERGYEPTMMTPAPSMTPAPAPAPAPKQAPLPTFNPVPKDPHKGLPPPPPSATAPKTNVQRPRPLQPPQASLEQRYAATLVFVAGDREYTEWEGNVTPYELRRWASQYAVRLDHVEEADDAVTFFAPPVVGKHGVGRHALRVVTEESAARIASAIGDERCR